MRVSMRRFRGSIANASKRVAEAVNEKRSLSELCRRDLLARSGSFGSVLSRTACSVGGGRISDEGLRDPWLVHTPRQDADGCPHPNDYRTGVRSVRADGGVLCRAMLHAVPASLHARIAATNADSCTNALQVPVRELAPVNVRATKCSSATPPSSNLQRSQTASLHHGRPQSMTPAMSRTQPMITRPPLASPSHARKEAPGPPSRPMFRAGAVKAGASGLVLASLARLSGRAQPVLGRDRRSGARTHAPVGARFDRSRAPSDSGGSRASSQGSRAESKVVTLEAAD